jgi:DNA-binding GntR family transcriptional regulator
MMQAKPFPPAHETQRSWKGQAGRCVTKGSDRDMNRRNVKLQQRSSSRPAQIRPRAANNADSKTEQVYKLIKHKIITLDYRPGQYLNESRICEELNTGRTPVHQAVHRLQLEGLVEVIPRKGVIVRPDSLNEMLDLLDARWINESYCAGLAAERATADQVAELERLLAAAKNYLSARSIHEFMQIDRQFHQMVRKACGNRVLDEILPALHDRSGRIWHMQVWSEEDFIRTQSEHEAILIGIKSGNREAATEAMQRHISSLYKRIVGR